MYTGGLENHPDLIDEMARRRQPLWGNPADVLRRVRSPFEVHDALSQAGRPCPAVCTGDAPPPADGRWLLKPLHGAGGSGIRLWSDGAPLPRWPFYWQELIEGEPCAAVYVGGGEAARLLGVTRQLVGEPWLHAALFHYCGSVGPLPLEPAQQQAFADLGAALGNAFGLKGLFGVDCVLRDGVPYPVEVNPRYTASVEVIEYATGLQALALPRRAFEASGGRRPPDARAHQGADAPRSPVVAKAILFARAPLRFPERSTWSSWMTVFPGAKVMPTFADVPQPGAVIEAGKPILTLLREAPTPDDALGELRHLADHLDRWLFGR